MGLRLQVTCDCCGTTVVVPDKDVNAYEHFWEYDTEFPIDLPDGWHFLKRKDLLCPTCWEAWGRVAPEEPPSFQWKPSSPPPTEAERQAETMRRLFAMAGRPVPPEFGGDNSVNE